MIGDALEAASADFASELQETLDGVLPGSRQVLAQKVLGGSRYLVGIADRDGQVAGVARGGGRNAGGRVAVTVAGEHLGDIRIALYLDLDRAGEYLKTVRSDMVLHSVLDKRPLARLEYRADMHSDPICHWQIHAERGAFTHLLTRAHAHDAGRVGKPHDLSSLHFPVGGERFRPCLEDFLQFLVSDCGVDAKPGWETVVEDGRERWRRRQLRSAVRDLPVEAADVLIALGWGVSQPGDDEHRLNLGPFRQW